MHANFCKINLGSCHRLRNIFTTKISRFTVLVILFCHSFTLCVSLFLPLSLLPFLFISIQGYFIIPIAVFAILSSLFLVVLPILQKPRPTLLALSATFIGIPFYIFLVMETPWKLRPAFLDRISSKFKPNVYVCLLLCQVFAVCTFC